MSRPWPAAALAALLVCALSSVLPVAAQFKKQATAPPDAAAQRVVARVFGQEIAAGALLLPGASLPQAADRLRALALREALERFIVENKLQATAAEIATYRKWEDEFGRVERERRTRQLAQLEAELKRTDLPADRRQTIEAGRAALLRLQQLDAPASAGKGPRKSGDPAADERALRIWIEGHKARAAVYQRYKGRVGITAMGPDPVGATEALLRDHAKRGDLVILDQPLEQAFWEGFLRQPQVPAAAEQIDFTLYWLKPVAK